MKKIAFLIAFCIPLIGHTQNSQLQNISIEHGLPQSQVTDIEQDSIGYLWIATQGGGMVKYDGNEFEVFSEKNGLNNNFVNDILIQGDSIYIATNSGISIYYKNTFHSLLGEATRKTINLNNTLYLATQKGVSIVKGDTIQPLKINYQIDFNPVNDIVYYNEFYWIANRFGLWKIDNLLTPKEVKRVDTNEITSLLVLENSLLVASFVKGLYLLDKNQLTSLNLEVKRITNLDFIKDQFYLSTDSYGLYILNKDFSLAKRIDQSSGLKVNHLKKSFLDQQDNIWLATSGGGIYKYTQNNFQHYSKNTGLKGNRVYAVKATKQNTLWNSNSEKGLVYIDSLGIHYVNVNSNLLNNKIKTLETDVFGRVWAGTDGGGIGIVTKEEVNLDSVFNTNTQNHFPLFSIDTLTTNQGLSSNWIKKIVADSLHVWVASYSSGISKIQLDTTKQITSIKNFNRKQGLADVYINDAVLDTEGRLWFATKNGSLGYIENDQIKYYHNLLGNSKSINSLTLSGNELYLGTLGAGVWKTSLSNPENFNQLTGKKSLTSNYIYQLSFDLDKNLWVGLRNGVNKVVLTENNTIDDVFYFGKSDGFLGIETCSNAIALDNSGKLWFGTMNGLTTYIPTDEERTLKTPTLSFEALQVNYQLVDSLPINAYGKTLSLLPTQNNISFQYKSVDLNHPNAIEYQWKLNNTTSNWTSNTQIDFANLDYGSYTIKVVARNRDGLISEPKTFSFLVKTPWYKTSNFILGSFTSAGLVLLLIVLFYVRNVKKKNKRKIEQLAMENHLLTLEQKALQLQMNPHFVFNVLNGIKALGNKGELGQMNQTISSFSDLLRSVLQSSRVEEISLEEEIKYLNNYLVLEQEMTSLSFDYKIEAELDGIATDEVLIPPMLIQPFVENAIKHGFKNIQYKGKICITFQKQGQFLNCSIKDNGIGLEASKEFSKIGHQSVALKVTQERLNSLTTNHQFQIKELKDNQEVTGTFVTFNLPFKTDF